MTKYVLDQWYGELDYPALGFRADPGDILSASAPPDGRWSVNGDQGAAETVTRYTIGMSDPSYVEPGDGHVLRWSDPDNSYKPYAASTLLEDEDFATELDALVAATRAPAGTGPAIWYVDDMPGADDDDRFAAAIAAWNAADRGGKIVFGAKVYALADQVILPNDGSSIPKQKTLILEGQGAAHNGAGGGINGGTIIDWTYNGAGVAKLDSRGSGLLNIRDITFRDTVNSTPPPFIQVTNTTPIFERLDFYGKNAQESAATDCIILGGGTRDIDGTSTAKFNGYKPIVKDCHFHRIRVAVWLRPGCNDGLVQGNTVWSDCGAGSDTYGAIRLTGASNGSIVGNVIADNTLESTHYPVTIKVDSYCKANIFRHNGLYDPSATTVCGIYFSDDATYNMIEAGYWDATFPYYLTSMAAAATTTFITSAQSQASIYAQPALHTDSVVMRRGSGHGVHVFATTGDRGQMRVTGGSPASPSYPTAYIGTSPALLVTDLVTTIDSNVVTSATANFSQLQRGVPLAAASNIPSNAYIIRVVDSTTVHLNVNATGSGSGITAQIGRVPQNSGGTFTDEIGFTRRHIHTQGAIGAAAKGAAAGGSGSSVSATGTDTAFTIDLTTNSTGTGVGTLCTVSFGIAFTSSRAVPVLTPLNAAAAKAMKDNEIYCSVSNTVFTLSAGAGTPAVSTQMLFAVHVIQS